MTVKQQELLSAFVDGELNADEVDQLLALLSENEEAKTDFLRYQFASDVLHGYTSSSQPFDLSTRISAALADEAPLNSLTKTPKAKVFRLPDWFWKQTAGLAAAASIGALAVLGVMNSEQTVVPTTAMTVAQTKAIETAPANANRWTVGEAEVEDRLNNYLVDHNEYAGASGMFSYARVVSYGEE